MSQLSTEFATNDWVLLYFHPLCNKTNLLFTIDHEAYEKRI